MLSAREVEAGSNNAERQLCVCLATAAKGYAVEPKEEHKLADLVWCKPKLDPSSARRHEL